MNVAHPDDMEEEVDDSSGDQDPVDSNQQAENAPVQKEVRAQRSATNPIIVNK